jgi:hypothetical protein
MGRIFRTQMHHPVENPVYGCVSIALGKKRRFVDVSVLFSGSRLFAT